MKLEIYDVANRLCREYDVPAAHIAAIIEVESNGIWDPCQIRWEGHYFDQRLTGSKLDRARALGIANPKVGGVRNPRSQEARYALLERAAQIDRQAAYESTSWGVGQVMGAHWATLGYPSAAALRDEALQGLEGQSRLMMRYVSTFGLLDELRDGRWAAFARGYNGPGYRKNAYDTKMAAAAERHGGRVAATDGMLRLGAKGARVREVQALLVRAGYSIRVDGDFGPATRDAVKAFQRLHGLTIDGVVGPKTMQAFAALRTSPDEAVGGEKVIENAAVQKAAAPVAVGVVLSTASGQIKEAAAEIVGIGVTGPWIDAVVSGLGTTAALLAASATLWAVVEYVRSKRTYEGVPA